MLGGAGGLGGAVGAGGGAVGAVGGASCTDDDGGSKRWEVVGVNYVLWLGGGVFDFFAGLIHSLSDAALL